MKTPAKHAVNACPEGGNHTFIMGRCFNCGLSIRVHKERVKETNRLKWRRSKAETGNLKPEKAYAH